MAGRFSKFLELDGRGRRLLFLAFAALGRARLDLRRKSFNELVAGLDRRDGDAPQAPIPADSPAAAMAGAVGEAIQSAAAHTPWESTCLVQVLAAQRMLQARGIAGEFCLGASREAEQGAPGFHAHAWLTSHGRFVTGETGHEKYRVLARYRWN